MLAISQAATIAGGLGGLAVWPSLVSVLAFMLLTMCAAAVVALTILHALRRTGVRRLENVHVEPTGKR